MRLAGDHQQRTRMFAGDPAKRAHADRRAFVGALEAEKTRNRSRDIQPQRPAAVFRGQVPRDRPVRDHGNGAAAVLHPDFARRITAMDNTAAACVE